MSALSAINSYRMSQAWQQAYAYMEMSRSYRTNQASQVGTPVEPVPPVGKSASVTETAPVLIYTFRDTQLPTEADLDNASETIARMRIQYPETDSQDQTPLLGAQLEYAEPILPGTEEQPLALGMQEDATQSAFPGLPGETEPDGNLIPGTSETKSPAEVMEETECQTCQRRKYQDGSDDPGVSFKSPTNIKPEQAESAVRGHEQEHVIRERAEAEREDRRVVSQSVTIHTEICPECGRIYISGGTTRTVTAEDQNQENEDLLQTAQNNRNDLAA